MPDSSYISGKSDEYHFAESETSKLVSACSRSKKYGESLYLVNFNVSDYYAHSFDSGLSSCEGYMSIQDVYLDMNVLTLFFENAHGEVYPLSVESNHINGVADVTPAPEEEQMNAAATEALKNWFANETSPWWESLLEFLKKLFTVIVILLLVALVLRVISWVLMMRKIKQQNTGQDPKPNRDRPRRQKRPYRERSWRSDRRRWKR